MGNILVKKITYNGDNYFYESPILGEGLNIIEGSNGSGKSTFMNLLYFGFSGSVPEFKKGNNGSHTEIANDTSNYVEIDLSLNGKGYLFKRFINSNDITVISASNEVTILPINRSKNEKYVFSDWILEKLEIAAVEVFQGVNHFKINFRDLLRLIYHDQELNPRKVYKSADFDNIISDSELVRKIIFQLLLGKSFSDYYSSLAKQKEAEKDKALKKALLDEYTSISRALKSNEEDLNLAFLNEKLKEKTDQLIKLQEYRNSLKIDRPSSNASFSEIALLKNDLLNNELKLTAIKRKQSELLEELLKLLNLKENLVLEVTQIKKIIHSHDKLSLFSSDTCPYCLRIVDRVKGHCVCGSEVEESQYERFFYNSDEYSRIFKAKQKTVETIQIAIDTSIEDEKSITEEIALINSSNEQLKDKIKPLINDIDSGFDSSQLNKVDDEILKVREQINSFGHRIEVEKKLEALQINFDTASRLFDELRDQAKALEIEANNDIRNKVDEFNIIYNNFMINTLKSCRSAKLDIDDYMPVINNGEYREASSTVPIRLMYYLTLLKMSIKNDDVKYPHLLLVDTPETAGIDEQNLLNGLLQISKLPEECEVSAFQVILSTAIDKYPPQYRDRVKVTLTDDSKLLKPKIAN